MVEGSRFELLKALPADLQSAPFGRSGNPPNQIDGRILIENPLVSSKNPFFYQFATESILFGILFRIF